MASFHSAFFGGDVFAADIYTLGFLPGIYFDLVLGPGASESVLGVTFTFVFGDFDAQGNFTPSDVDNNGREDTALKEVWYNDAFTWTTTNTTDIDIQTVALHENGHTSRWVTRKGVREHQRREAAGQPAGCHERLHPGRPAHPAGNR